MQHFGLIEFLLQVWTVDKYFFLQYFKFIITVRKSAQFGNFALNFAIPHSSALPISSILDLHIFALSLLFLGLIWEVL